ncbi:metallophosphoesterase 1 isoform X2 [Camelus dromedarius]|uniref:metallophosphoesterase 1 isoform X2 n=1 Tax=Camelus dromedarius TaxID=9838 RepID=UPI0031194E87
MKAGQSCLFGRHTMAVIRLGSGRPPTRRAFLLLKLTAVTLSVLLFCEFLIYYGVIVRCHWPEVETPADSRGRGPPEPALRAMFLADTHLLGAVRGHWLDKLRREWQMERAFQTALWLLQPEVVFILGDVFDEGKWSSSQAWADDVGRFQTMFRHPAHVQLRVVAGNHDVGFHYQMNTYKIKRFEKVFNPERLFSWKGINFVLVNSVAMEGDGCDICSGAEAELLEISRQLNCSREEHHPGRCGDGGPLPASAPVLLQHFPLYRRSDAHCSGEDAAPPAERGIPFQERYDVLSREASRKLLWWLRPRLVLSGHTHHACEVLHGAGVLEVSVPSFSWRNRNDPSFIMVGEHLFSSQSFRTYLNQHSDQLCTYCNLWKYTKAARKRPSPQTHQRGHLSGDGCSGGGPHSVLPCRDGSASSACSILQGSRVIFLHSLHPVTSP